MDPKHRLFMILYVQLLLGCLLGWLYCMTTGHFLLATGPAAALIIGTSVLGDVRQG